MEPRRATRPSSSLGEWKDRRDLPRGQVMRVLGRAGEHNVEMHAILAEFGLPLEFPESVIKASRGDPQRLHARGDHEAPRCARRSPRSPSTRMMRRTWMTR